MAEPGDYSKLPIKQYPPRSIRETAEGKFWRGFSSPVLTQQVGPVSHIDFNPVYPHDFAITSSTRVRIAGGKSTSFGVFPNFNGNGLLLDAGSRRQFLHPCL